MRRKPKVGKSRLQYNATKIVVWILSLLVVYLMMNRVHVIVVNVTSAITSLCDFSSPPSTNDTVEASTVELIPVWCDLSWEIYIPPYCMDGNRVTVSPCYIPKDERYIILIMGTFSWSADPHYYTYYLPDVQAFIDVVGKIYSGNYYCEVNQHNLVETYLRGLDVGSSDTVWYNVY